MGIVNKIIFCLVIGCICLFALAFNSAIKYKELSIRVYELESNSLNKQDCIEVGIPIKGGEPL